MLLRLPTTLRDNVVSVIQPCRFDAVAQASDATAVFRATAPDCSIGRLSNSLRPVDLSICLDLAYHAAAVSIERPRLVIHAQHLAGKHSCMADELKAAVRWWHCSSFIASADRRSVDRWAMAAN